MQWELLVALAIGIPIILFPAAFMWYVNIGGIVAAIKEKVNRAVPEKQGDSANYHSPTWSMRS